MRNLIHVLLLFLLLIPVGLISCGDSDGVESDEVFSGIADSAADYTWDSTQVRSIVLTQDDIRSDAETGVSVSGNTVLITSPGTYRISGTLSNGQIRVRCAGDGLVRLLLDGADVTCSDNPPLWIEDAERVLVYLLPQTISHLTDGAAYASADATSGEPDAALFSKADLLLAGEGTLVVNAKYKDGIASKDGLLIKNGTITVTSADDGIRGRDCLQVKGGAITVTSSGDGMVSTNDEDLDWGYVTLDPCQVCISSGGDAIAAVRSVAVDGGNIQLKSGGGSGRTVSSTSSAKGIKAGDKLYINGGNLTISAADDALHAATSVIINGGTMALSTSDDGIHSDASVYLNDGDFTLSSSYEGVEGSTIVFTAGTWRITSSNDCLNASMGLVSGGTESDDGSLLRVDGGTILLNIAGNGDGIDSNGDLTVNNGILVVQGPSSAPEVSMDYNGTFTMNGGFLIASGPNSGNMIQPTSSSYASSSSLYCVVVSVSSAVTSSSWFHLQDAEGTDLVTFKPLRSAYYFVFASPLLKNGSTCAAYTGGSYSGGTALNGYYSGGSYSGGTLQKSLSLSSGKLVSSVSYSGGGGGRPF